jgi:hypothetical protein
MKCPHCLISIHPSFQETSLANGNYIGTEDKIRTGWIAKYMTCPSCSKAILHLVKKKSRGNPTTYLIYPQHQTRLPASAVVPKELADDFNEAAKVLPHSAKASAALSRRCLQHLLHLQGFKNGNLSIAIEKAILTLPSHLSENLDAVRNIGNFAAHPAKNKSTGEIVNVEPHEASWNLEVLESLFDHYYVRPHISKVKRKSLDEKLAGAGKPPMKK